MTTKGPQSFVQKSRIQVGHTNNPIERTILTGHQIIPVHSGLSCCVNPESQHDLAAVGGLSAGLAAGNADDQADRILDWTRDVLSVEAAEIFLREPGEQDMLLSYFRGDSESAFSEIGRFHVGQGYPGLVLENGEPIGTDDLWSDDRYLREGVKSKGFRSYLCVPLRGADGIIGTINVASRNTDFEVERTARILNWAGVSISSILENTTLRARLSAMTPISSSGEGVGLEDLSLSMLGKMMAVGDASAGELRIFRPQLDGVLHRITLGPFSEEVRPENAPPCPALTGDQSIALSGAGTQWSQHCSHMTSNTDVVQCLPLIANGKPVGLVQLQYGSRGPRPVTKHMTVLHSIAAQVANVLAQARDTALAIEKRPRTDVSGQDEDGTSGPDELNGAAQESEAVRLDINCFGSFNLVLDGSQIPPGSVQRRGAITLLKMLVINSGHAVTRDAMAEALWPGADPELIANRIHVLIHALRQAIEPPGNGRKREWKYIRNDGDRYYLNPDAPYRSDVQEFRDLASAGDLLESHGNSKEAAAAYEKALELYTGDLLEDEPYAEWCWAEREHLRETALDVAIKLAVQHARWRELDRSISFYRRALRIDSLREEIHRGLIATLIAADRRPEAIRQYDVCSETLEKELGVTPLPETRQLVYPFSPDFA